MAREDGTNGNKADLHAFAREIDSKVTPLELIMQPTTVVQLAALLQLVLRHSHLPPDLRQTAERFLDGVREYFDDCPTVLDVLRRGDDPRYDVKV
jgi:hypothetical protein